MKFNIKKVFIVMMLVALVSVGLGLGNNKNEAEASGSMRSLALKVAKGKKYQYGANNKYYVDCSGFAQQFMKARGKNIPRTTYGQMRAGKRTYNPKPGDLVFFNGGSHVGVYVGKDKMVDALNPAFKVGERRISWIDGYVSGYYRY